jgi:hypothetical protein
MDRPDKTIGTGKQNFILFTEIERETFESLPVALSIEESLITAYGLLNAAKSVYRTGSAMKTEAGDLSDVEIDLFNFQQSMNAVAGEIKMDRADAMVAFAAGILELCEPEIRLNIYPDANRV